MRFGQGFKADILVRNYWRWDDQGHQTMKYPPLMDTVEELAGIAKQMIFYEVCYCLPVRVCRLLCGFLCV